MTEGDPRVPFFIPLNARTAAPTGRPCGLQPGGLCSSQTAFLTLLLRMHDVHTRVRRTPSVVATRTVCRLGYQRRLVLLFAWLTLFPVTGPLPHTLQTRAIGVSLGRTRGTEGQSKPCKITIWPPQCNRLGTPYRDLHAYRPHHRYHGPGRLLPGRIPPR